ncbi:uncharacterized protein FFMR_00720 [Fusarium fujikuroi]|uniref:Uncharacterized protein n=1 Tax=Fusarium fujikuroi TaxID=5127 RepID=A0A9Q9RYQ5_FUSFU|nr:uncharacterized protein FFMR_00720 [Fusarium fujikuroi]VTT63343.1 unnamed protein product [Fusarium fujikuroi]VTT81763.1 unnamed protein product [Fusarium fujikuroi]VZH93729.1 unnamed protein product [Fusarium fujikuroi]
MVVVVEPPVVQSLTTNPSVKSAEDTIMPSQSDCTDMLGVGRYSYLAGPPEPESPHGKKSSTIQTSHAVDFILGRWP